MNIGQLFVGLGVKGAEKSLGAIGGIRNSLKETKSIGLETKAAIIGAVYALERLFSKSFQQGNDLANFNATLGISTKTLQEYQYAARQVGVSNEEVAGSFANIQRIITDVKLNKGAPESMALLGKLTGMTQEDFFKSDFKPEILIQKLQEAAEKLKDAPGLKNKLFADFGMGPGMSAALSRQAFQPEIMRRAPTYSEGEISALDRANAAWSNLGTKIQMAVGHFNAAHGGKIVKDLDMVTTSALKLAEALIKISDEFRLFQKLSDVFKGWSQVLNGDVTKEAKALAKERYGDDGTMSQLRALFDVVTDRDYAAADVGVQESKEQHKAMVGKQKVVRDIDQAWTPEEIAAFKEKRKPDPALVAAQQAAMPSAAPTAPKEQAAPAVPQTQAAPKAPPTQAAPTAPKTQAAPTAAQPALKLVPAPATANAAQQAAPALPSVVGTNTNNVTVTQTLNFQHEGKDAKRTGDSVKAAVQKVFRQSPSLAQGS